MGRNYTSERKNQSTQLWKQDSASGNHRSDRKKGNLFRGLKVWPCCRLATVELVRLKQPKGMLLLPLFWGRKASGSGWPWLPRSLPLGSLFLVPSPGSGHGPTGFSAPRRESIRNGKGCFLHVRIQLQLSPNRLFKFGFQSFPCMAGSILKAEL